MINGWPTVRRWLVDAGVAVAVLAVAEITIITGREPGAVPPDWLAYLLGVAMALPVLLRRRFPVVALYLVSVALLLFYGAGYPGFAPSVVLAVPLYDAARAGRHWWALPVPVAFLSIGYAAAVREGQTPLSVAVMLLPSVALPAVAMLLGALVRSRWAYAAEVRHRMRHAEQQRDREAERRVVEDTDPDELLQAVRVVARGDALLSPAVTRTVIARSVSAAPPDSAPRPEAPELAPLTARERDVVRLVATGLTNQEIAEQLVVSPLTAKTHVSRAMAKVGARAQLVVFAYQTGLVTP